MPRIVPVWAALGTAMLLIGTLGLLWATRPASIPVPESWGSFAANGSVIRHPRDFSASVSPPTCGRQIVVTNLDELAPADHTRDGCTLPWQRIAAERPHSIMIVVEEFGTLDEAMMQQVTQMTGLISEMQTELPLRMEDAVPFPFSQDPRTTDAVRKVILARLHDSHYEVVAILGPGATPADEAIARRIVGSFHPSAGA